MIGHAVRTARSNNGRAGRIAFAYDRLSIPVRILNEVEHGHSRPCRDIQHIPVSALVSGVAAEIRSGYVDLRCLRASGHIAGACLVFAIVDEVLAFKCRMHCVPGKRTVCDPELPLVAGCLDLVPEFRNPYNGVIGRPGKLRIHVLFVGDHVVDDVEFLHAGPWPDLIERRASHRSPDTGNRIFKSDCLTETGELCVCAARPAYAIGPCRGRLSNCRSCAENDAAHEFSPLVFSS